MKNGLVLLMTAVGVVAGMLVAWPNSGASASQPEIGERWLNANHVQIRIADQWVDVPLMALDERACRSPELEKYCD